MNNKIEEILKTEFSNDFVEKMKNSMCVSYYKYGSIRKNYQRDCVPIDAILNIKKRIERYEETNNKDYLIDIANFAIIEFMNPNKGFYKPTDGTDNLEGLSVKEMEDRKKASEFGFY